MKLILFQLTTIILFISLTLSSCKETDEPEIKKEDKIKVGAWYFGGWSFPADDNGYTFHISPSLVNDFPEREPIWGWREDGDGVMEMQIDYAANAGLSYWGFCWYENSLTGQKEYMDNLNNALELFLQSPNNDRLEFFLMSSFPVQDSNWGKVIDGTVPYFKKSNYLKVDGKPIIAFFNSDQMLDEFGVGSGVKSRLEKLRGKARDIGMGEILVGARSASYSNQSGYKNSGFDFVFAYHYADEGRTHAGKNDYKNLNVAANTAWDKIAMNSSLPFFATVGVGYDMRPWAADHPTMPASDYWYTGVTSEKIGEHLREGIAWTKENHDDVLGNLLMMYAWNENGEGAWLTPTNYENNARLEAVQKIIDEELNN